MSRTIRRKNGRNHSPFRYSINEGYKTALQYTEYDVIRRGHYAYRAPTKQERFRRYKFNHLDNRSNCYSAGWNYRHARVVQNRCINKNELIKWYKDPEGYEPLFEANPRSCRWDWC